MPVKLSIATVCYEINDELFDTLDSLGESLMHPDIELLIQASQSSASGRDTLVSRFGNALQSGHMRCMPDGDSGIFNAMNKLRQAATGTYLWYLNAGDKMHPDISLDELLELLTKPTCYGFRSLQVWQQDGYVRPASKVKAPLAISIGHQSAIYHRDAYGQIPFDEDRIVSADQKFNMDCFARSGFIYIPRILSIFELGGQSTRHNFTDFKLFDKEPLSTRIKFLLKAGIKRLVGQRYLYRLLAWRKYDHVKLDILAD